MDATTHFKEKKSSFAININCKFLLWVGTSCGSSWGRGAAAAAHSPWARGAAQTRVPPPDGLLS